eukprot:scaffold706_cov418-Prasinococcus_capsulatus_cf.AAC.53
MGPASPSIRMILCWRSLLLTRPCEHPPQRLMHFVSSAHSCKYIAQLKPAPRGHPHSAVVCQLRHWRLPQVPVCLHASTLTEWSRGL